MPPRSPARSGFAAVLRRPVLLFAEVCWRWTFGIAALGLLALTFLLFLDTIPISPGDRALMGSGSPFLAADALAHILLASKAPLLRAAAFLVPGLALLWTLAAGFGRSVTVPPLLGFAEDAHLRAAVLAEGAGFSRAPRPPETTRPSAPEERALPALFFLAFLRAALLLAAFGGYLGSAYLASKFSWSGDDVDLRLFLAIFLALMVMVVICWAVLNWLVSLAPLLAVRDRLSAPSAVSGALRAFAANPRDFLAVSTMYGLLKLLAIVVATGLGVIALLTFGSLPRALVMAALVAITLLYLVFADLLYLARLAAYAALLEAPQPEPAPTDACPVPS